MSLVGGYFLMGSPPTQAGRGDDEIQHSVTVQSFRVADREVSVGEFREFVAKTGYRTDCEKNGRCWVALRQGGWASKSDACWDNAYRDQDERDPVALVSWYDAVAFLNWRSRRDGLVVAYTIALVDDARRVVWDRAADGYRLPTEAEWEYAARRGAIALPDERDARVKIAKKAGAIPDDPKSAGAASALEWCWDWYAAYDEHQAHADPVGPARGMARVCRGVSMTGCDRNVRFTRRGRLDPELASSVLGLRLVQSGGDAMLAEATPPIGR